MHILLVAPPMLALNLGEYLERQGHAVDYAATGALGLHRAMAQVFDVIVMAGRLPDTRGCQACRMLRKTLRSSCPLLVLLGEAHESPVSAHGADALVAAPFTAEDVRAQLAALVRQRRQTSP